MNKTEIYKYYGWSPEDGDYIRENEMKEETRYLGYNKLIFYLRIILSRIQKIF